MASSDLENNKIFAAILIAGIVAMMAGFIADQFFHEDDLEEDAYPIEVAEEPVAGGAVVEATAEPIDDLIATADAATGAQLVKACAACHSFEQGGPNKIGPNLWGIYGGPKAHLASFAYSDGLKNMEGSWDVQALNEFLWKPKSYIPDTKMNYVGLRKPEDRAHVIKYLQTLK